MSLFKKLKGKAARKLEHAVWSKTLQELNAAEVTATPRHYVDIVNRKAGTLTEAGAAFAADRLVGSYLLQAGRLQPFVRQPVSTHVDFYADPDTPGRDLLVVFTDRVAGPMMALPMFLQSIDAARFSVLVLRDPDKLQFRTGIPDYAGDMDAIAQRIDTDFGGYDRRLAIGTSMGGFAAVRFFLQGGTDRAISVGGRAPYDALALMAGTPLPGPFDPICACLPPAERDLVYVFSGKHERDRAAARLAASQTGGTLVRVSNIETHNVLNTLRRRGKLTAFLATLLADDPVDGRRVQVRG